MNPNPRLAAVLAAAAIAVGGGLAQGAVDCATVMRSLKAGASPQEVAKTMAISAQDVKDCQDSAELDSASKSHGGATLERGDNGGENDSEESDSNVEL
jgi:hypothetical protein